MRRCIRQNGRGAIRLSGAKAWRLRHAGLNRGASGPERQVQTESELTAWGGYTDGCFSLIVAPLDCLARLPRPPLMGRVFLCRQPRQTPELQGRSGVGVMTWPVCVASRLCHAGSKAGGVPAAAQWLRPTMAAVAISSSSRASELAPPRANGFSSGFSE